MLASMSNGVVTIDEDGVITTCNKAGLKILKVHFSEIIGHKANDFFSNGRSWMLEKFNSAMKQKRISC